MRIRKIQLSGVSFVVIFSHPERAFQIIENPIPKDSRIIDIVKDSLRNCYWMVVESDTFEDIPEGIEAATLPAPVIRVLEEK